MAAIRGFKIDATTGDFAFVGGRLQMVEGAEAIAQSLRARLRLIKGEWPFDTSVGVDYFGTVLVKNPNRGSIQTAISNAILSTPGIATLENIDFTYTASTRTLAVTFEATMDTGELVAETVEI